MSATSISSNKVSMRAPGTVRDRVAINDSASGATGGCDFVAEMGAAAQPRARQLAIYMTTHGVNHGRNFISYGCLALLPQTVAVSHQRRERRLHTMREIGGATARTDDILFPGVERSIDLIDERLNFVGNARAQMLFPRPERISATPRRSASSGRRPIPT